MVDSCFVCLGGSRFSVSGLVGVKKKCVMRRLRIFMLFRGLLVSLGPHRTRALLSSVNRGLLNTCLGICRDYVRVLNSRVARHSPAMYSTYARAADRNRANVGRDVLLCLVSASNSPRSARTLASHRVEMSLRRALRTL